jgi:hypothetical protein
VLTAQRQQGLPVSQALVRDREAVRTSFLRRKRRIAALQGGKGTPQSAPRTSRARGGTS